MMPAAAAVNGELREQLKSERRAIYLPAIGTSFTKFVESGQLTSGSAIQARDLDFLDPENRLFHYPFALYSAGQHNTSRAPVADMVSKRDRSRTIVLGDSGGYQVSTTEGYFSPELVLQNMTWMEEIADFSMVLDFPTGGIASGKMAPHIERLTSEGQDLRAINNSNRLGLDYNACLRQTQLNNDAFLRNRTPAKTMFLNVLQGRSEAESKHWYESVKHYSFDGWAFAGHHQNRFSLMLARLIDMREDALLDQIKWIHVLGVATLPIGVLLTRLQRFLNEQLDTNIQFSFDTASAFLSSANQQIFSGATLDEHGWSTQYEAPSDWQRTEENRNLGDLLADALDARPKEDRHRRVARTVVSRTFTLGDLRNPSDGLLSPGGYNLLTHHNVEALIDAHEEAHEVVYGDALLRDPSRIPLSVATMGEMIEQVLNCRASLGRQKIKEWRAQLDQLRSGF